MKNIKIGFAPTRRSIFSAPDAVKYAGLTRKKLEDLGINFVDINDISEDGLLHNEHDRIKIAEKFKSAGIDGLFFPHCNFGTEYEAARLAKELQVPVLLWGPRDERPDENGIRLRDSQCGLFATGKVLRRFQVPFTYLCSCRLEDAEFERGIRNFLAVCSVVRAFRSIRILQIGPRPFDFWSTMCNEGELLEKFNIQLAPVPLPELTAEMKKAKEEGSQVAEVISYCREHFEINRHVILALRAHKLHEKGENYIVSRDRKLLLMDGSTGRSLDGMKLRGGQHQALEVKEGVPLTQESRAVAVVTFQNLFLMFPKLAGMSGTLADASEELRDVYGVEVLVIPTNRPRKRKDLPDQYFPNSDLQIRTAAIAALKIHETGRPVLIVAANIENTERMSKIFMRTKIPHNVLNANNAYWEAQIVKEAGQRNAVTVATTMAGRGTDIKLGEGVEELGGLAVIGIGRMDNVRMERQARGRAGRQGDAGTSQFFVSLEDDLIGENPSLEKYIEERRRIRKRKLKKIINKTQISGEEGAVMARKNAVVYDKVIQKQRGLIYATRDKLLEGEELPRDMILRMADGNIRSFLASCKNLDRRTLNRYILDNISYQLDKEATELAIEDREDIERYLMKKVRQVIEEQEKKVGSTKRMDEFIRVAVLNAVDNGWVEQVDYMQQLQAAVSGRSFAQRNLLFEYQNESFESFRQMESTVYRNAMRSILLSDIYLDERENLHILFP